MDKTKKQRKKVDESDIPEPIKWPEFNVRISPERIQEYQAIVNDGIREYKTKRNLLNKALKSFWPRDKSVLELAKQVQKTDFTDGMSFWTAFFALDFIETRLSNIEIIVKSITEKLDVDLSNLKSQIETLQKTLAQPELEEVSKFVHDMYAKIDEGKKMSGKYVS